MDAWSVESTLYNRIFNKKSIDGKLGSESITLWLFALSVTLLHTTILCVSIATRPPSLTSPVLKHFNSRSIH
jgi:hypothetical protein